MVPCKLIRSFCVPSLNTANKGRHKLQTLFQRMILHFQKKPTPFRKYWSVSGGIFRKCKHHFMNNYQSMFQRTFCSEHNPYNCAVSSATSEKTFLGVKIIHCIPFQAVYIAFENKTVHQKYPFILLVYWGTLITLIALSISFISAFQQKNNWAR